MTDQSAGPEPNPAGWFVILLTLLAAIGGFLFGYDTGVVSGAMIMLKKEFELDSEWQEAIVSVTVAAAAVFAFVSGFANDKFGRRPVILVASFVFGVGAILLAVAKNKEMLLVGRGIIGVGLGFASSTTPMYIAESSPPHLRGRLVTMNNVFVTGGQFIAGITDGAFSYVSNGWRYMLGLACVPAAIMFVGFIFLPESPRWLIEHEKYEEAQGVLVKVRGSRRAANKEFTAVKNAYEEEARDIQEQGNGVILWKMLKSSNLRRALVVGCGLQLFQQVTGINTIMYYSATIIEMSGVSDYHTQIWLAAVAAGVNFFCTFIGLYLVETIGRRSLTLWSISGVFLSLLWLAIGFQVMASTSPPVLILEGNPTQGCSAMSTCDSCINRMDCGFCYDTSASNYNGSCLTTTKETSGHSEFGRCLNENSNSMWAYNWCPTQYSWIIIIGLVLYLFCFAAGMGPMPWTINTEIYPQWARSTGNSCATFTNWTFNLIVSMTFLTLMESITKQGAYYLYTSLALIALLFFYWCLPETKGKTLEQIENLFELQWVSKEYARTKLHCGVSVTPEGGVGGKYVRLECRPNSSSEPLLASSDSDPEQITIFSS